MIRELFQSFFGSITDEVFLLLITNLINDGTTALILLMQAIRCLLSALSAWFTFEVEEGLLKFKHVIVPNKVYCDVA